MVFKPRKEFSTEKLCIYNYNSFSFLEACNWVLVKKSGFMVRLVKKNNPRFFKNWRSSPRKECMQEETKNSGWDQKYQWFINSYSGWTKQAFRVLHIAMSAPSTFPQFWFYHKYSTFYLHTLHTASFCSYVCYIPIKNSASVIF